MTKRWLAQILIVFMFPSISLAYGVRDFVTTAGKGILAGAALGVVSLAFEDHPEDSWNNVARGASLGLYGGIAYALYSAQKPEISPESSFSLMPIFSKDKKIEGLAYNHLIFSF